MINYNTVEEVYARNFGSETLYKRNNSSHLNYTEGVMDFQKSLNAFWVVDNVVSYVFAVLNSYKATQNDFYVVEIVINSNHQGYMEVYTEGFVDGEYNEHISIIKQEIPYIDLPLNNNKTTSYKFYLELSSLDPITFTLLLPREH